MATEQQKNWARKYLEEGAKTPSIFDEMLAPNAVISYSGTEEPVHGPQAVKQLYNTYREAFPDIRVTVDNIIGEGDEVAVRYRITGTHKGSFQGIPSTNKKFNSWGLEMLRFENGKIVEDYGVMDTWSIMEQLGVSPTQSQAQAKR